MTLSGLFKLFEMKFLESAIVPIFELVLSSALEVSFKKLPSFSVLIKKSNQFQIFVDGPFRIVDVGSEVAYVMFPQLLGCAIYIDNKLLGK